MYMMLIELFWIYYMGVIIMVFFFYILIINFFFFFITQFFALHSLHYTLYKKIKKSTFYAYIKNVRI